MLFCCVYIVGYFLGNSIMLVVYIISAHIMVIYKEFLRLWLFVLLFGYWP